MRRKPPNLVREVLLFDGAMGTMLQKTGLLKPGAAPELLNIEHSEAVALVHRAYFAAGSGCVETNTFGGSRLKLADFGLGDRVAELNTAAVALARREAGEERLVAASIGPTGKLMAPLGELTFTQAYNTFTEQCHIVAAAGADLINIETMSELLETKAAIVAALETGLPVMASVSLLENGRLLTGETPEQIAAVLSGFPLYALGINCGLTAAGMQSIVPRLAEYSRHPLIIQPNAGKPVVQDGRTEYKESPQEFAAVAALLINAGARIIGGCCGTTPDHIQTLGRHAALQTPAPAKFNSQEYLVGKKGIFPVNQVDKSGASWHLTLGPGFPAWDDLVKGNTDPLIELILEAANNLNFQSALIDISPALRNDSAVIIEIARTVSAFWPHSIILKTEEPILATAFLTNTPGRVLISAASASTALKECATKYGAFFRR